MLLTIALLALGNYCPGYSLRGIEYDICVNSLNPGLYVIDNESGRGFKVDAQQWLSSQFDTSMGDDERLGA